MRRELPQLSPEVRETIEGLIEDSESLVDRALGAIFEEVSEYAANADPGLAASVRDMVAVNVDLWYEALLTGRRPPPSKLAPLDTIARERVYHRIPLDALLRAFRVGGVAYWRTLLDACRTRPEIQQEVLFELSPFSLVHFDIVSHTISHGYLDELAHQTRRRDRLTDQLMNAVFDAADEEAFAGCLAALGLDPQRHYCAVALRPRHDSTDAHGADADRHASLRQVMSALGLQADSAIGSVRHGYLAIWLPAPTTDAGDWEAKLEGRVEGVVASNGPVDAAGIGTVSAGAQGWRTSFDQATRALEIAARMGEQPVRRYFDLALYDVALRTPELSDFLRTVLERLGGESDLLASLDAYFGSGRHVKTAAAALQIHPNTLSYRLRRVEELLEGRLDDSEWTLRLQLALKLRQVDGAGR